LLACPEGLEPLYGEKRITSHRVSEYLPMKDETKRIRNQLRTSVSRLIKPSQRLAALAVSDSLACLMSMWARVP
jgi:hypothetical protein